MKLVVAEQAWEDFPQWQANAGRPLTVVRFSSQIRALRLPEVVSRQPCLSPSRLF